MQPILGLVVPCFNEHEMLEETIKQLSAVLGELIEKNKISSKSCMLSETGTKYNKICLT